MRIKSFSPLRRNRQKGLWAATDEGLFDRKITGPFKR
jgi:hypothetical protein